MLSGLKSVAVCAGIAAGLVAGAQVAVGASVSLTGADIYGSWAGTFQYTSAPQILNYGTGLITEETAYETGAQDIIIGFNEDGAGVFDFIPVIDDEQYDGAFRRLLSAVITGNQLTWVETVADVLDNDDEFFDVATIEYTLTFSADATQQYLIGTLSGRFLIGSYGEARVAFASLSDEDEGDYDDYFDEYYLATGANLYLARPISGTQPPVTAVPLPAALQGGLVMLGGLGLAGIISRRRRSMA